ncbi:MAG: DNA methylase N-4/N-6 domain protein [Pusillimonas sp.]|nr:DNA methylase N-4/N-6 domain protein [Pusillimonas sp.]|tara:strand:+ start:43590 stop:44825 length:1236 start_codon:yes stop_codon:yes gene_type:complete
MTTQLNLFEYVQRAYANTSDAVLDNTTLYRQVARLANIKESALTQKSPIGKSKQLHSVMKRKIRWYQQTLRSMGIIERVTDRRGVWALTQAGRQKLKSICPDVAVLGFSTELGVAIWSDCHRVFSQWDEPICLALTSPPYPLARARAYGGPSIEDYSDFICRVIEPIVKNLVPGGNVVLNVGDVFEPGLPAKSTYIEELIIDLRKRMGLYLMNRIVWESNKPPGPIQWASKQRMQLNEGYEHVLWFCNDPSQCIADNRRVLEPHTERHRKLMARGGESRRAVYGDGAYRIRPGSYQNQTEGAILRNVWKLSNNCPSQRRYKQMAQDLGLQAHGASMPLKLAQRVIRFMTQVDELVVDPLAGSITTGLAAELEGRRWACTDKIFDYVRGGAQRFLDRPGFNLHLDFPGAVND